MRTAAPDPAQIGAVVVIHESAGVIRGCLETLRESAPRRGLAILVVDNASTDDGADVAAGILGPERVLRLEENHGFAAGVNAGFARLGQPWLAIVNPDLAFARGALDRLADFLEGHPRAGLAGPRVRLANGAIEPTAGVFPTIAREEAHAWMLDRWLGRPGRSRRQPPAAERADWISGCAWLLRREAWQAAGPLDEDYFMYVEDIDYGRRLANAGWEVWIEPAIEAVHARGTGSRRSALLPADGGPALAHYFAKHEPQVPQRRLLAALRSGWALRRALHALLARAGRRESRMLERRYALALERIGLPSRD